MKRIAVGLMVLGTALAAGSTAAQAAVDDGYNTNDPQVTVAPPSTTPGGAYTVTVSDCIVGETATFKDSLNTTKSATCVAGANNTQRLSETIVAGGTASVQFNAPNTTGTFPGTVALDQSDTTLPWNITVAAGTVTVSNSSPTGGSTFTVSTDCAQPTATVTFNGSTTTVNTSGGKATATLTAPNTAGTASGTISCGSAVASFSVNVQAAAPGLPATGNSGMGGTLTIAVILLLAGAGIYGVSLMRRRQSASAA